MEQSMDSVGGFSPRVAIQGCRPDGTVFFWNLASEELYGIPVSRAVGNNLGDLIIPAPEREYFSQFLRRGQASGETGEFLPSARLVLQNRAGKAVPVYSSHLAVRSGESEVLLFRFDLDLSGGGVPPAPPEQKPSDPDLKKREELFHTVFDSADDAIYIETPDGRILEVNQAVCDMLGYTREELLTMRVSDILPPDRADALSEVIRRESTRRGAYIETENLRKDGTLVPVEVSNTLVELGGEKRVIAIVRDISRRKKAEQELHNLDDQLRQAQKMEMAATLAGGMAHDFGNLLNAIRGYVELIKERLAAEDPLRQHIARLDQAVTRAGILIRKLLALGRKDKPAIETVNLNRILGDLASMLQRVCGKGIRLTFDLEQNLGEITAAAEQVEQVIINLVLNGREAISGEGTVSIATKTVDLSLSPVPRMIGKKPGTYIALIIADTGCGMTSAQKARIFEPFFTTKDGKNNSGLGMAIVYGIVESYGGFIQVESTPGEGSAFTIYFPARQLVENGPVGRRRVLLMDPELESRTSAVRILTGLGYDVNPASYAGMAVEFYRLAREANRPFDVVLLAQTDAGGQQNADLLKQLQEIDPEVTAVICGRYPDDPVMAGFRDYGFTAALEKPFTVHSLAETLRALGIPPPSGVGTG